VSDGRGKKMREWKKKEKRGKEEEEEEGEKERKEIRGRKVNASWG
jgi:hypothetical protein